MWHFLARRVAGPASGRSLDMATTSRFVAAPPEAVWAELTDGWTYSSWVPGTVKIRAVDDGWPAVGTKIHHAVGLWPLTLKDETESTRCERPSRLTLQARGWPAGEAVIDLRLTAVTGGTEVRAHETPTHGPGAWVNNPLAEAVLRYRIREMLDRLGRIAEGHAGRRPSP
jgi:carbon monoxide dehydrogenase subunit G